MTFFQFLQPWRWAEFKEKRRQAALEEDRKASERVRQMGLDLAAIHANAPRPSYTPPRRRAYDSPSYSESSYSPPTIDFGGGYDGGSSDYSGGSSGGSDFSGGGGDFGGGGGSSDW